jgi:phage pi2 protein 07
MKNYIFAIIFISTLNLFSIEYDLDVITLPYDSLNIEDIVVSNFTILARSGNTIYKSTDDGENWKIAFESELKVNQLYSKDPHTILLVGEKGMVYRTMDYGENWLDESVEDKYDINMIAAKDYSNYLAIAQNRWVYYKDNQFSNWKTYDYYTTVHLSTLEYAEDKYYFGGGSTSRDYYYRNEHYFEFTMGLAAFNGISFDGFRIGYTWGDYDRVRKRNSDSLRLFSINNIIYATTTDYNDSYVTAGKDFMFNYEEYYDLYKIKNDVVVGLLNYSDTIYVFSRKGMVEIVTKEDLSRKGSNKESYKLNIDHVNQIKNPYDKVIYLSSNNSRIYKMSIYEPISSIQLETNNLVKQYNDRLWVDNEVEIIGVYNYIGQKLNIKFESNNFIEFNPGIYYISFEYRHETYNHKIMVN